MTELERAVVRYGSVDPAEVDAQGRLKPDVWVMEVLQHVSKTKNDPLFQHDAARSKVVGGLTAALFMTFKVYQVNLGYNLLMEFIEGEVKKMPPQKYADSKALTKGLAALAKRIETQTKLPLTKESRELAHQLELDDTAGYLFLEALGKQDVPENDRKDLANRVRQLWRSWWPQGDALLGSGS